MDLERIISIGGQEFKVPPVIPETEEFKEFVRKVAFAVHEEVNKPPLPPDPHIRREPQGDIVFERLGTPWGPPDDYRAAETIVLFELGRSEMKVPGKVDNPPQTAATSSQS